LRNETINILSQSATNSKGGPGKVYINTIKGFDRIGQPYVINKNPLDYKFNWVHDDINSLIFIAVHKIPCVVGPNLFILPKDMPWLLPSLKHSIYLHPAKWCTYLWENFKECPIHVWPVGIDWELFITDRNKRDKKQVLLYFKKQHPVLKKIAIQHLEYAGYEVNIIEYGNYIEENYRIALESSYFGVWIGTTESQGIGLQEALASGLPLIVLDNKNVRQIQSQALLDLPKYLEKYEATTVPYWDERCGLVINSIDELPGAINQMIENYNNFQPLAYIKENLSMEGCAQQLVNQFSHIEDKITLFYAKSVKSNAYKKTVILVIKILFKFRSNLKRLYRKVYRTIKKF